MKREILDQSAEKQIKSKKDAIHRIEKTLKKLRTLVKEYQSEYKVILDVSSKFAYILTSNSLTVSSSYLHSYFQTKILFLSF